jgi:hypothetical protein
MPTQTLAPMPREQKPHSQREQKVYKTTEKYLHLFPEIGARLHRLPDPLLQWNHRLISEHLPGLLDVVVPRDSDQADARRSERRLERLFQNWAEGLV